MIYYIGTIPCTPSLKHFGILGQKWGVRRYQNEDGSLTEAGKARYGYGSESENSNYNDPKQLKRAQEGWSKAYQNNYIDINNKTADFMNSIGIEKFNQHWDNVKIDDVDEFNEAYESSYFETINALMSIEAFHILGALPGSDEDQIIKDANEVLRKNGILD